MSPTFSFGDCELDEDAFELRRLGHRVELQPKVLEVLCFLVRHRDRVVSKRELMDALWSDASVGDGSLTRCMSVLRRAIGDTNRREGAIRTVARHGYRFCAPALERAPAPTLERSPAQAEPAALAATPVEWPFVGRDSTQALLARAAAAACHGRMQLVELIGPAGIGKTRTLDWFVAHVRSLGGGVASGRCPEGDEGGAFWPWIQLLRSLRECLRQGGCASSPTAELRALARLLPAITPDGGGSHRLDRSSGRFRLFQDIAELLERASTRFRGPLALAIDDLHRADAGSLMLLRHLAHELRSSRIVLLLALRGAVDSAFEPLAEALTELARVEGFQSQSLAPFGSDEIARLVELRTGRRHDAEVVEALLERTDGNPFLVREALRWLEREGLPLPESAELPGVRTLFEPRLRRLSKESRQLLELASVIGREFAWSTLASASPPSSVDLLNALDEAERAELVVPLAGGMRYRFVHALVCDLIYRRLPGARRADLHRAVGEALEQQLDARRDTVLPRLAHHFFHAARVTDPERALRYAVASAEQARAAFAPEEAAEQYARALELLELCDPGAAERRLALLLALGQACADSGDTRRRREAFLAAAVIARGLGRARDLARAALGYCGSGEWRLSDAPTRSLLEEGLDALPPDAEVMRARLLARLAHRPVRAGDAASLAELALASARSAGDAEALCEAHHAVHFALEAPEAWARRASVSDDILETGARARRSDLLLEARLERMANALLCGDRFSAERELDEARALAQQSQHPWFRWLVQVSSAGLALLRGHFEGIEQAIQAGFALGQRVQNPWSVPFFLVQTFCWRRQCGPLDVLVALLHGARSADGWSSSLVRVAPAALCTDLGDAEGARRDFADIAAQGFASIPRDRDWLATTGELAATCALVGDASQADELRELLTPHEQQQIVLPYVIAYAGPIARVLALLAIARRDARAVRRHFESALASTAALGAEPWHARVQVSYATWRLRTGGAKRDAAALDLLRAGEQSGRKLGLECAIRADQQRIAAIAAR